MIEKELEATNWFGRKIDTSLNINNGYNCWDYWDKWYYPNIIIERYPVYYHDHDKGKLAYEIAKMLSEKRFVKLKEVRDFIKLMDELIKCL